MLFIIVCYNLFSVNIIEQIESRIDILIKILFELYVKYPIFLIESRIEHIKILNFIDL